MSLYSIYSSDDQDVKKAVQYLTSAATKGNAQAQWNLCELYAKGEGVPKSSELSMKWMKKSAQNGNVEAQLSLANYYEQDATKDVILSFEWCLLAADQGFPEAQFQLGEKLMNGIGCQQNVSLAIQHFEKAVKEGHVLSMLNLGLIYFQSSTLQNHEKSLKFLLLAAENGNIDAQHNIGYFFASKNEFEKAFTWYMKSHLANHPNSFSEISQMILRNELKFKKVSGFIAKEAMNGNEQAIKLLQELKERGEE
ncbi:predicted protein [Naegleria gruberi]|uniref:Predicted protein n=1 Tax=Naegleria gruberi TaxID=5762 RepID=D2V989_NAEGR|nr:uncharacterized protein NAEGRDRAFT_32261 [Naegleria gruberi]EFC46547.1 predicted protein [Naegleria gruberi]|eukprot:XP_002679291.1 predicted protein [Naegleria gruberi strain NEG-M]